MVALSAGLIDESNLYKQDLLHELNIAAQNNNWSEYDRLIQRSPYYIVNDQFNYAILNNKLSQRLRQPEIL